MTYSHRVTKSQTQLKWLSTHTHTKYEMKYYSTIKRNEILPTAVTWTDLDNIILSKISHTKTNII